MKYKILDLLKNRKDFISGQELAHIFNVSRTAVWKNISRLKAEGYNIESVSNRGYKLIENEDILNENEIDYRPLYYIDETDSTNNTAKALARDGCEGGLLVVCANQTLGRGRFGREWVTQRDCNLSMSMVLKPDIMPYEAPQLTLVAGIACVRAIENITGLKCGIKWPNDIILRGKKLVGILTEMSAEMEFVRYAVVGIGININNDFFNEEIKDKATSIYIETGKKYKRSIFADAVSKELKALYEIYCRDGFKAFVREYNSLCINVGQYVKTQGRESLEGKALGVNDRGELLIETDEGIKNVLSGEVSLRLANNKYI